VQTIRVVNSRGLPPWVSRADDPDNDPVARDGEVVTVHPMFMDAAQRAVAAQVADAALDDPQLLTPLGTPAGYGPGFAGTVRDYQRASGYNSARDTLSSERGYYLTPGEAARQQRIIRQSEAWKSIAWAKQHKPKPGGLGRDSAPPPPDRSTDAACQRVRDEACRRRCERLANAWRNT
jgi:hypothetical protein